MGTFLLAGVPLLRAEGAGELSTAEEAAILKAVDFYTGQSVEDSYLYGFQHLTEVALRALSPGINDPATAVMCLHALGRLLALRIAHPPATRFADAHDTVRVHTVEPSLEILVELYLCPVWDYGKGDRSVRAAFKGLLPQLVGTADREEDVAPLRRLWRALEAEEEK